MRSWDCVGEGGGVLVVGGDGVLVSVLVADGIGEVTALDACAYKWGAGGGEAVGADHGVDGLQGGGGEGLCHVGGDGIGAGAEWFGFGFRCEEGGKGAWARARARARAWGGAFLFAYEVVDGGVWKGRWRGLGMVVSAFLEASLVVLACEEVGVGV